MHRDGYAPRIIAENAKMDRDLPFYYLKRDQKTGNKVQCAVAQLSSSAGNRVIHSSQILGL
jgi:hypothetical protein